VKYFGVLKNAMSVLDALIVHNAIVIANGHDTHPADRLGPVRLYSHSFCSASLLAL